MKLAKALDTDAHEPVRRALAAGEILVDQAAVIVRAVDALPDDAEPWVAPKAQQWLLDQARPPRRQTLRMLGKRILEVVDPAAADAHEARLLEQEERAAEAAAMFRMHDDGHGRCHGKFTISSRHGAMLKKALLATAAPKHQAAVNGQAPEPGVPTAHKMGLAFQEYIETYPADALPKAGGVNATVVVTMTLEALLGGLKAARLDTGEKITAGEARRLAGGVFLIRQGHIIADRRPFIIPPVDEEEALNVIGVGLGCAGPVLDERAMVVPKWPRGWGHRGGRRCRSAAIRASLRRW